MGDTNTGPVETTVENTGQPSIDILRETKPEPDVSIKGASIKQASKPVDKEGDSQDSTPAQNPEEPAKIETVFEKLDVSSDKSDSTTDSAVMENTENSKTKTQVEIPPLDFEIKDTTQVLRPDKHASDIFSLKEDNSKQKSVNSIWSISGAPSGRINRKKDNASSIFPAGCMGCKDEQEQQSPRRFLDATEAAQYQAGHIDSTPRKRPTSSKPRNPLTGVGVDDDVRKTSSRKKDGNPLLGLGYEEEKSAEITSSSAPRIPPGGHSKGLW